MTLADSRLVWSAPIPGTYSVALTGTNEIGLAVTKSISIRIDAAGRSWVSFVWSRSSTDAYYIFSLYDLSHSTWIAADYLRSPGTSRDLRPGSYIASVLAFDANYRPSPVGYRYFSVPLSGAVVISGGR
ncbi:MAG: hypothetical protein HY720_31300 [Planctomycetes bacterium]|nr:hypothetical protein [Planctomycetota bacterium]